MGKVKNRNLSLESTFSTLSKGSLGMNVICRGEIESKKKNKNKLNNSHLQTQSSSTF